MNIGLKKVDYVGYANERLILSACYKTGKGSLKETIFIHEGKVSFLYKGSIISEKYFDGTITEEQALWICGEIRDKANVWCRNLGLPEVTKVEMYIDNQKVIEW